MFETSKSMLRRTYDQRFATRYFVGNGIDIGAGPDPLGNFRPLFPLMGEVKAWDLDDGDAMLMESVPDETYDFVHSSHCLEHMVNPTVAIENWVRICKPGGHLVIVVPDEDLYEQGVWPSTFNTDHKSTFTIYKQHSWSPRSLNVVHVLTPTLWQTAVLRIETLDMGFIYDAQRVDQTQYISGECAIEIVLRKRTPTEIARYGRYPVA